MVSRSRLFKIFTMSDNCSCCFTDTLAKCENQIRVNILLPPYYDGFRWVITDKFGNKYQGELAENEEGYYIPLTELPDGLLTQYSGDFTLQIFPLGDQSCGPLNFKVMGQYDCIEFGITGGTFEKNNLGCEI